MAKYQITRSCGHEEEVNICGPGKDRDRKAEWEGRKLCRDCYKAKMDAERAEASAKAAESNKGLPALEGSEKQIAWAETIRAKAIAEIDSFIARGEAAGELTDEQADQLAYLKTYRAEIAADTSCRNWIDKRDIRGKAEAAKLYREKVMA